MDVYRHESSIHLKLTLEERLFLLRILTAIRANYQVNPSDLDAKSARAWYATDGCPTPGGPTPDTAEWIRQLHQFKSENLALINRWLALLGNSTEGKESLALTLSFEETPSFLQVLNDHRLLTVNRHDLGDRELGSDFLKVIETLEPQQQLALCEVNLLAHLMEYVLQALPDSGADWNEPEGGRKPFTP